MIFLPSSPFKGVWHGQPTYLSLVSQWKVYPKHVHQIQKFQSSVDSNQSKIGCSICKLVASATSDQHHVGIQPVMIVTVCYVFDHILGSRKSSSKLTRVQESFVHRSRFRSHRCPAYKEHGGIKSPVKKYCVTASLSNASSYSLFLMHSCRKLHKSPQLFHCFLSLSISYFPKSWSTSKWSPLPLCTVFGLLQQQ